MRVLQPMLKSCGYRSNACREKQYELNKFNRNIEKFIEANFKCSFVFLHYGASGQADHS